VGLRRSLAQVFILALALQAIAIVSPFYMQWAVDGAVVSPTATSSPCWAGVPAARHRAGDAHGAALWVVLYLSTTMNLQWLANVFSHLLRLPVSYFEKRHLAMSCRASAR
jgi:ATP-binding cassette subfamily B protein RaxB